MTDTIDATPEDGEPTLSAPLPPCTVALLHRAADLLRRQPRQPLADADDDMA